MKLCPKCKEQTLAYIHGCGWDYDMWLCHNKQCDYENVLEITTYPKEEQNSTTRIDELKSLIDEIDMMEKDER